MSEGPRVNAFLSSWVSLCEVVTPCLATVALAIGSSGCHERSDASSAGRDADRSLDASARSAVPASSASALASAHPSPITQKCRAISVAGTANILPYSLAPAPAANAPTNVSANVPALVTESSEIPDDVWVDLSAPGKLTVKHPHSTRETTFTGPSLFRSCVAHAEETWLASGTFESVLSSGERVGAEEWVATPVGVIRYGAARVLVDVTGRTATAPAKALIKVTTGKAFVWTGDVAGPLEPIEAAKTPKGAAPDGGTDTLAGWTVLEGARSITLTERRAAKPEDAAKAAVDRCVANAKVARDLAAAVASPDAALAQIAPQHVVARHLARAACSVAWVRTSRLEPSPGRDALAASVKQADLEWKVFRPHTGRARVPAP